MNEQEYKLIRNLAWDLLIDAGIKSLPVDIKAIAKIYDLETLISEEKTVYENTLIVTSEILKLFGTNNADFSKYLTVRILAPMIVLKELCIESAESLSDVTGLPIDVANYRLKRLKMLVERDAFETSNLESIVLSQFRDWISTQK